MTDWIIELYLPDNTYLVSVGDCITVSTIAEPSLTGDRREISPYSVNYVPLTLLLFSLDACDVANFVQNPQWVKRLQQFARGDISDISSPLARGDLQLIGVSGYDKSGCGEFVDLTFRGGDGDHMLRVWRDVNQPVLGVSNIDSYCFLSGHYLPGYEGLLWSDFVRPNQPELTEPAARLTTSNGTISRTLYRLPSDSETVMLAVEHRTVLSVHQYRHEVTGQVEYHQNGSSFYKIFEELSRFDRPMHPDIPLNRVVRTPVGRGATSGYERSALETPDYRANRVTVKAKNPMPSSTVKPNIRLTKKA